MIIPGFTGSLLDRADEARHDDAMVSAMRSDPDALLLEMDGLHPIGAESGTLGWTPLRYATVETDIALLGRIEGTPRFVALQPGVSALRRTPELFAAITAMAPSDAGTYATARSLVDWHARHGFCPNCGTATMVFRAGWGRVCPNCNAEHFPRVDPVVIMLAEHGEGAARRILVGRQRAWDKGRYSALAGFVEVGESIEEAVARELHEEAGVRVSEVRYLASQPWPFPAQLMMACIARVADIAITLDIDELEDAKWVDAAEVRAALAGEPGSFGAPPPFAIAHTLLARWLDEQSPAP